MTSLRYKFIQSFLRAIRYRFKIVEDARNHNARYSSPHGALARRWKKSEFEGRDIWTIHPKSGPSDRVYLHQHGGAYVYGITPIHWKPMAELADLAGLTVILPEYPLPPKTARDIHAWAVSHYRSVQEFYGIENVILGGDSAGGNLALAIAQIMKKNGMPLLNPLILWSPWVDLIPMEEITKDDDYEALITPYALEPAVQEFVGGMERADPLISPLFADLSKLPPLHIITGGRDILHPQIMELRAKADVVGKLAGEIIEPEYGHYWMFYPVPDRHKTLRQIANILHV